MSRRAFIADAIAAVPAFAACTKKELQALTRLATELDVPQGRVLTTEGRPGHELLIVLDGTAEATRNGKSVASFGPGDCFGEIALLDPGPRTATVTARTPMTLAVIGPTEFNAALDEVPTLAHKIMRGLARRLREVEAGSVA